MDGAIHRAAGPELLEECRTLGGCRTGSAKITKGYNLKASFVIHAVGPVYHGRDTDAELLASCYTASLELAVGHGCRSVAFPCISTGVYGYPLEDACNIVIDTVLKWFANNDSKIDVYLCCYSDREYDTFRKILNQVG